LGNPEHAGVHPSGSAGARGIVLLVVALILGVLLLQKFDRRPPFSTKVSSAPTTVTTRRAPSVSVLPPTSARALRSPEQVKVLAANATNQSGLAGRTRDFLINNGYNALAPVDATKTLDATRVEYKPDFEPEARTLAQLLQLPASSVVPLEASPPVPDSSAADILVIAGADLKLPTATTTTTK
jgi:hypothetical protein